MPLLKMIWFFLTMLFFAISIGGFLHMADNFDTAPLGYVIFFVMGVATLAATIRGILDDK